jgi:hypothetical protein
MSRRQAISLLSIAARVCGQTGEYACYGYKRGWNYAWRLP